ncbi:hypothetical protein MNV49_004933 [Pseudohyphozyma bogoriensis]|nr:hypothetical protein MNV49_004933 [Pseudohyphozyma bogoriensis]
MAVGPAYESYLPSPAFAHSALRVSAQAKLTQLISSALALLEKDDTPILLHPFAHARPAAPTTPAASTSTAPPPAKPLAVNASLLPKLISIVEIIKRSFPTAPLSSSTSAAPPKGSPTLHQYTLLTTLSSPPAAAGSTKSYEDVTKDWISGGGGGTKRPKLKHEPVLLVVLSKTKLGGFVEKGWTHQPPAPAKKSGNANGKRPAQEGESDETGTGAGGTTTKKPRKRRMKKKNAIAAAKAAAEAAAAGEGGSTRTEGGGVEAAGGDGEQMEGVVQGEDSGEE